MRPDILIWIFWGVRQGSCCDGVDDGDSGQPDMDGRHGEDGGQLAAVLASENVEFCESSLLIATGMGNEEKTWLPGKGMISWMALMEGKQSFQWMEEQNGLWVWPGLVWQRFCSSSEVL